jgi:hypothetical protein
LREQFLDGTADVGGALTTGSQPDGDCANKEMEDAADGESCARKELQCPRAGYLFGRICGLF